MPKPITKNQLADLWFEEFATHGACCLCGNHGVIDTKGKVLLLLELKSEQKFFAFALMVEH